VGRQAQVQRFSSAVPPPAGRIPGPGRPAHPGLARRPDKRCRTLSPDEAALEAARKSIGNRGELYSYQLERLNAEVASDIVGVSRDNDNLGHDIEDRSVNPRRRIEVKASGDTTVRFFLSDNEWDKAHEHSDHYEIHF
jgi:hypothetical protein